jgi:hypothetical protein
MLTILHESVPKVCNDFSEIKRTTSVSFLLPQPGTIPANVFYPDLLQAGMGAAVTDRFAT